MQESDTEMDVLSTPGHLVSLAARGFARLSEAHLKPLGFGVGHLPVLVALQTGRADTQRDLARFAQIQQPPMAQMLTRMERDGLIRRTTNPADGRSSRVALTKLALARLPDAIATLLQGNRDATTGFTDKEVAQFLALLNRLISNLDRLAGAPQVNPDPAACRSAPSLARRPTRPSCRSEPLGRGHPKRSRNGPR